MAITSTGTNAAYAPVETTSTFENPEDKTELTTDDFMTLLLAELQYQDPTEPTDTEAILTQTSQLASLEATDKTNAALEKLATSLESSNDFSTISAIGKTADLGSNAIGYDEGTTTTFEVYFPNEITAGSIEILDSDGRIIGTQPIEPNPAGVYQFDWNGELSDGGQADSGVYYITASYSDENGEPQTTRMGAYPVESVRFEDGNTLLKVGSTYVALEDVVEIY